MLAVQSPQVSRTRPARTKIASRLPAGDLECAIVEYTSISRLLPLLLLPSTEDQAVKCTCTHCGELVTQDRNPEGPNYCTNCQKLFVASPEPRVPTWILGVVVFLMANWQILRTV